MPDAMIPDTTIPDATMPEAVMWHRRLAHLHSAALWSLIDGVRVTHNKEQCDVCVQTKHNRGLCRSTYVGCVTTHHSWRLPGSRDIVVSFLYTRTHPFTPRQFIRTMVKRATKPFELVHSDTCGPFATPTKINGYRYFILFADDYPRWTEFEVYFLHEKKAESCTSAHQSFQ